MDYFQQIWRHSRGLRMATYVAAVGLTLTLATAQPVPPAVLSTEGAEATSVWQKIRSRLPWGGDSLPERLHRSADKAVDGFEQVIDAGVGIADRISERVVTRRSPRPSDSPPPP